MPHQQRPRCTEHRHEAVQLDWYFYRHADFAADPQYQHEKGWCSLHLKHQHADQSIDPMAQEEAQIILDEQRVFLLPLDDQSGRVCVPDSEQVVSLGGREVYRLLLRVQEVPYAHVPWTCDRFEDLPDHLCRHQIILQVPGL